MAHLVRLATVLLLVLALPSVAYGSAYTAWVKHATHDPVGYPGTTHCSQAGIEDVAINVSHVRAYSSSTCSTTRVLPSGWLGVRAHGQRDGVYCASTSWFYSNRADYYWWVKSQLCSNPAGTQEFRTLADTRMYDGAGWYFTHSIGPSPAQNY